MLRPFKKYYVFTVFDFFMYLSEACLLDFIELPIAGYTRAHLQTGYQPFDEDFMTESVQSAFGAAAVTLTGSASTICA